MLEVQQQFPLEFSGRNKQARKPPEKGVTEVSPGQGSPSRGDAARGKSEIAGTAGGSIDYENNRHVVQQVSLVQKGADLFMAVTVQAGARMSQVTGFKNNSLKLSVKAVREKGKANEAVIELLADFFHIAKSRIEIVSGHSSKQKRLLLRNCTVEEIIQKVETRCSEN